MLVLVDVQYFGFCQLGARTLDLPKQVDRRELEGLKDELIAEYLQGAHTSSDAVRRVAAVFLIALPDGDIVWRELTQHGRDPVPFERTDEVGKGLLVLSDRGSRQLS